MKNNSREKTLLQLITLSQKGELKKVVEKSDLFFRKFGQDPRALLIRANALQKLHRITEASDIYHLLTSFEDEYKISAYLKLAEINFHEGKYITSLDLYYKTLKLDVDNDKVHYLIFEIWQKLSNTNNAKKHALILKDLTNDSSILIRIAMFLARNQETYIAWEIVSQVWSKEEDPIKNPELLSAMLGISQNCCENEITHSLNKIIHENYRLKSIKTSELGLWHLALCTDEKINKIQLDRPSLIKHKFQHPPREKSKKITIGYVTSDIHEHATMHLMKGVFKHHDKNSFDIYIINHSTEKQNSYTDFLIQQNIKIFNIQDISDIEAAQLIFKLKIDILVDLKGQTYGERLDIFNYKPAPIQVTYLGFPGSSGLDAIDYCIGDYIVTPESSALHYKEKIIRLPNSYQCNDDQRHLPEPTSRELHKLPHDKFIFTSFNQAYKIDPDTIKAWQKILTFASDSYLWLLDQGEYTNNNILRLFAQSNINSERIKFAPRLSQKENIDRLSLADLYLDTFNYNGHTTASDCLWAGTPVLTKIGNNFASRVASSLCYAVNQSDLICKTEEEYTSLAINIYNDRDLLKKLKNNLKNQKNTSPLFNTEEFTRNLERSYKIIYQRFQEKLPPDHINL